MTRERAIEILKELWLLESEHIDSFEDEENEAFDMAISVLKESKEEWIPVSEGLPERYKEVIVTDIETSDTYLSRYIGNGYWECDNGLFKNRIIAWQPKPKPYKEEKEVSE